MPNNPAFLENSPKVIYEQIVLLIKNSNLNFQLKETPFGLYIQLKKRFVQTWPQSNGGYFSQAHAVPQTHPQHVQSPQPFSGTQNYPNPKTSFSNTDPTFESKVKASTPECDEILDKSSCLKQTLKDVQMDKENIEHDYNSLENSYRKLVKRHKRALSQT
jgi:hypothetical protein